MREAWLLIYTDPQSYDKNVHLYYSEPENYYLSDPDYEVKHIAYIEIE